MEAGACWEPGAGMESRDGADTGSAASFPGQGLLFLGPQPRADGATVGLGGCGGASRFGVCPGWRGPDSSRLGLPLHPEASRPSCWVLPVTDFGNLWNIFSLLVPDLPYFLSSLPKSIPL